MVPVRHADRNKDDGVGGDNPDNITNTPKKNYHPTVKPIKLMQYLCRLITPKGGLVLDPFAGSSSTGCAAVLEGFQFVGIELEKDYYEISAKRLEYWEKQRRNKNGWDRQDLYV